MSKIITIKHERLLLSLFYYLLSKGITKPITEKQYFSIVNETIEKINNDKSPLTRTVAINDEKFEEVVKKANLLNSSGQTVIELLWYENSLAVKATYSLIQPTLWYERSLGWYPRQEEIFHEVIDSKIEQNTTKRLKFKISPEQLSIAKKIAAKYVNAIVQKYVDREIERDRWPSQCRNVDEYVFQRNIAQYIDEEGTAEVFKKLYLNAIEVVCRLIKENKGELQFSNRDKDLLAFANYLKFFDSEELGLFIPLKYNEYKTNDVYIKCTVLDGDVICSSRICIYSASYDDDDIYQNQEGTISEKEVEIMERRIGNIC